MKAARFVSWLLFATLFFVLGRSSMPEPARGMVAPQTPPHSHITLAEALSSGSTASGPTSGAIEMLLGDGLVGNPLDGDDCLWDKSKAADTVVCGGGSDQVNSIRTTGHIDACEIPATCCNWAHFVGAC